MPASSTTNMECKMQDQMELPSQRKKAAQNRNSSLKSIPGPKPRVLVGNLPDIQFDQFHCYLKENSHQYGDIFKLSLAQKTMVVLSNPETVRTILKNRPDQFRRVSAMQAVFSELGINGVFSAEGEEWKVQRKMMNQAFKMSQLVHYYPTIIETTNQLITKLDESCKQGGTLDFQALMQRFTIDITTQLAFGYDVNSLDNSDSEFQKNCATVFPMISYRLKAPFPYWRYFKMKKDKALDSAMSFIRENCDQFIIDAEEKVKHKEVPGNILESMIMARDEEGIQFSHQQLFANIVTLLLAGEDTTANTLAWVIHYLIKEPAYQAQLQQEIAEKTEGLDLRDPKSLDQLPLLSAVIQEAMRLMPVAPLLYMENIHDQNIEGYDIPAGTMLTLLVSQAGHEAANFPTPEAFKPDRWLNMTDEEKKHHGKTLMHFGSGARLCPGMQLAYLEIKYALIAMLRQFTFSVEESCSPSSYFAFTVMPKDLIVKVSRHKS
ncbi:cytochrome P450 [Pseudomonadota bacterium]